MSEINAGQFYDGKRFGIQPMLNLSLSASLKISVGYDFNAIRFPERQTNNSLNIHAINTRVIYMFNTKLSATVFVQYVNTEDEMISNFRLRYNPREGNDFYLVFNDFRSLSGKTKTPPAPSFYDKTVMVKYTHTFIL
jgi:hypothetical protein